MKTGFQKRLSTMLTVDFRRMLTSRLFYIVLGICFVAPILILVMTTMMDGTVTVDPQTGKETVIEAFDHVWQIIGTVSGDDAAAGMAMDMTAMCNINLLFFGVAVPVALFVSEEFKCGYAKNLFTVRAKKSDYVVSKTVVCFLWGVAMVIAFFLGSLVGGAVSGLSFEAGVGGGSIALCLLCKVLLMAVFVPIFLCISVAAKEKTWLSIVGGCAVGALLFMMIPALTPLNATVMNLLLCGVGGVVFSLGLGAVSNMILSKTSLV
ncbi:MAG: ABC transporter permease [Clostridia bacterium]|nr:ABC transporter permease [Clostridia bacterium]